MPPKGHPCGYFKLSGRSQTTISHEILSKTKVYVFLFTTWMLPKSKKEHRLSALKNHPVLSLHYRIITHLLYKVWEMPKSMKKERRVIYDSIF